MISLHKWGGGYKAISSIMSTRTEVKVSQQRNTDQIRTLSIALFLEVSMVESDSQRFRLSSPYKQSDVLTQLIF